MVKAAKADRGRKPRAAWGDGYDASGATAGYGTEGAAGAEYDGTQNADITAFVGTTNISAVIVRSAAYCTTAAPSSNVHNTQEPHPRRHRSSPSRTP